MSLKESQIKLQIILKMQLNGITQNLTMLMMVVLVHGCSLRI
uniref:Uncharacterized protein n=1 Tax=Tetranychus urticae TaxID=32264 RepID=T1JXJ6_TETUR